MQNDQVLKIELGIKDNILKTYNFTQDVVEIGRISTADIFIDNNGISRQHTRIERSIGGPYIVKDMGSTNGTFLNDRQINEAALKTDDIISIGKFSLRVSIKEESKAKNSPVSLSPGDFDGTTVLSTDQMARLRAGIENDYPDVSKQKSVESTIKTDSNIQDPGLSISQLLLWGGVILAAIVVGFFVFKSM